MNEPRGQLTAQQIAVLLQPIRPERVYTAQNQSHVPAYDITAHLTRVLGWGGWDKEILSLDLVSEQVVGDPGKQRAWVTYRCLMRLTIRDPEGLVVKIIEEGATGSSSNMPTVGDAHDFAMKNAISFALKRCAKDLGDQFGLSLYNKGSRNALVGKTLVTGQLEGASEEAVDDHVPQVDGEGEDPTASPPANVNEHGEMSDDERDWLSAEAANDGQGGFNGPPPGPSRVERAQRARDDVAAAARDDVAAAARLVDASSSPGDGMTPAEREAVAKERGRERAAEARAALAEASAGRPEPTGPAPHEPATAASDAPPPSPPTPHDADGTGAPSHMLEPIMHLVSDSEPQAKSRLLRRALAVATENGFPLTSTFGWSDLADGPIAEALVAEYTRAAS